MILDTFDIEFYEENNLSQNLLAYHKPTGVYFKRLYRNNKNFLKVREPAWVEESMIYNVDNFDEFVEFKGEPYKFMYETDILTNRNLNKQLGQIENALSDDGYTFIAVKMNEGSPIGKTVSYYVETEMKETEFSHFEIGQLNPKGEIIDIKKFNGENQKSFFEAVDYFEGLILKRQPQPKQEDPSVGVFVYLRNLGGSRQPDSFAEVFGNKVVISYKDLDKVFTPPVKKPFGRLDMYAVEDSKYDVIKGKFALNFDDNLTDAIGEKMGRTSKEEIFVYKMTPYETSEGGEESETPEGVNNENLSLDKIEGEEPENMTGEGQEGQEGQEGPRASVFRAVGAERRA